MLQHLVTDVPVSEWVSEWVIDKFCLEVVRGCLEDVWCLYGLHTMEGVQRACAVSTPFQWLPYGRILCRK